MAETSPLRISLYHFFNAEQAITTPALPIPPSSTDFILPSCFSHSSLHTLSAVDLIKASHGSRSSSVSGIPLDILSMFDCGWRESPSINGIERDSATSLPMVDLPLMVSSTSGHITLPEQCHSVEIRTKMRDPDDELRPSMMSGIRTMTIIKIGLGSLGGTVSSTSSFLNSSTALA
jgi:hypothetical protein